MTSIKYVLFKQGNTYNNRSKEENNLQYIIISPTLDCCRQCFSWDIASSTWVVVKFSTFHGDSRFSRWFAFTLNTSCNRKYIVNISDGPWVGLCTIWHAFHAFAKKITDYKSRGHGGPLYFYVPGLQNILFCPMIHK